MINENSRQDAPSGEVTPAAWQWRYVGQGDHEWKTPTGGRQITKEELKRERPIEQRPLYAAGYPVALALWQAWMELNAIRARDGVPRDHTGHRVSVSEEYFSKVVDDTEAAYRLVTGEQIQPWPPRASSSASPDPSVPETKD